MIEIIKKAIEQGINGAGLTSLINGEVMSTSPLKIKLKNDDKLILPEGAFIVPQHLKVYTVTADITGGEGLTSVHGFSSFSLPQATVQIDNSLKKGDKLMVISCNEKQKYYILDRI